jgi:hypothetical protein
MNARTITAGWLGLSLLVMLAGTVGPWGDIVFGHTVKGWDTSGGPTTLVFAFLIGGLCLPAALLPRSPKALRVALASIGAFFALLMAALGVYWAVGIDNLVGSAAGVEGAGWGVWVTAIGAVSTLLAAIGVTVAAIRSRRPLVAGAGQPAGWYPDPSATGLQRYWDGAQWTQHTNPA